MSVHYTPVYSIYVNNYLRFASVLQFSLMLFPNTKMLQATYRKCVLYSFAIIHGCFVLFGAVFAAAADFFLGSHKKQHTHTNNVLRLTTAIYSWYMWIQLSVYTSSSVKRSLFGKFLHCVIFVYYLRIKQRKNSSLSEHHIFLIAMLFFSVCAFCV